jgi:hypothetical protein
MEVVNEENITFSAKELVHFVLYPKLKTSYQVEQVGLLRFLRGYAHAATMDEIVAFSNLWIIFWTDIDYLG